jgi:hypothetical protein
MPVLSTIGRILSICFLLTSFNRRRRIVSTCKQGDNSRTTVNVTASGANFEGRSSKEEKEGGRHVAKEKSNQSRSNWVCQDKKEPEGAPYES